MKSSQQLILEELKKKPLIKQRTPEWFKLREDRLTASDLYDAIKNPLSLARKKLKGTTFSSNSIPALKWGTMFEPMATRIYSSNMNKEVFEFGLIINDDIKNFGASPDGITEDGVMIEIKCPYSRKIVDGVIPEKYNYQIQGQLAVCNLNECDYIECEFMTFMTEDEYLTGIKDIDNSNHGIIIEKKENNGEIIYKYSSEKQNGQMNINEFKDYKYNNQWKFNYWKLNTINIQKVSFNKDDWNNKIVPKINQFYEIYMKEKNINKEPINLFMEEDD
jgi:putative phage-type endonuclease